MTGNDEPKSEPTPAPKRQRTPVPPGYREGIITAITVLLGFSLAFFRYWGFEAEGQWSFRSVLATGILIVAVVMQIIALFAFFCGLQMTMRSNMERPLAGSLLPPWCCSLQY